MTLRMGYIPLSFRTGDSSPIIGWVPRRKVENPFSLMDFSLFSWCILTTKTGIPLENITQIVTKSKRKKSYQLTDNDVVSLASDEPVDTTNQYPPINLLWNWTYYELKTLMALFLVFPNPDISDGVMEMVPRLQNFSACDKLKYKQLSPTLDLS